MIPQLTLPEALRYFFSPFVIVFYFCLLSPETVKSLAKDFGLIPTIAAVVAGVTIYYVYRYCLYNDLILPLYDRWRERRGIDNHRLFIMKRYNIPRNSISSTRTANRILHELSDNEEYSNAMAKRQRPMRASGVHLLYQSGIFAFIFSVLAATYHERWVAAVLLVFCGLQLFTAARIDFEYENEELILIRTMLKLLDEAAAKLNLRAESAEQA
jgi:hypothetical protein